MQKFRTLYALGFMMCVVMIGTALFFFQRFLGLEPCPLCILQRVVVMSLGMVLLVAAIHGPNGWGNRIYGGLITLISGSGAAIAGRHVWLQSLPADQVPECGPTLDYILETFPLSKALQLVLHGSGECAKVEWQFLGLSIPGWTLIAFSGFILFGLMLLLRRRSGLPAP
jgi:protein dithiol:quinone oxidoreductase